MRACASAVLVILFVPTSLFASTLTWRGNVDTNWSNAGNWAEGVAPSLGDDLVFADTQGTHVTINDFPNGMTFNSLTFAPSGTTKGYSVSGSEIFITGTIDAQSSLSSTTLSLPIRLAASQTWTTGGGAFTVNATVDLGLFTLTLAPAGSLTLAQPVRGRGDLIINGSGIVVSEALNTYTSRTTVNANATLACDGCGIAGSVRLNAGRLVFAQGPPGNNAAPTTGPVTSLGGEVAVSASGGHSGSLSLDSSSIFTGNRGTLFVAGSVSLGGARLSYDPPSMTIYTLIDNDGTDAVTGTFNGLPEGALIGGRALSYHDGTGNDVTLSTNSVPPPRTTTTALHAALNPLMAGTTTTLTATVTASDGPATGGSVTFSEGSVVLAAATVVDGQAVATVGPFFGRGQHTLTAVYSSGGAYVGSTSPPLVLSVFVPAAATTTTLDVSPASSKIGDRVTLTATVTATDAFPLGMVTLYDGDAILNSQILAGGTVSFTTTSFAIGVHHLVAAFTPTTVDTAPSVSDVVTLVVGAAARHRAAGH